VALAEVDEALDAHQSAELVLVLAPLLGPVHGAVLVELVGGPLEAHDQAVHVVALGDCLHDIHERVEKEPGEYHDLVVFLPALAVGELRAVARGDGFRLALDLEVLHCRPPSPSLAFDGLRMSQAERSLNHQKAMRYYDKQH
jgi:hypothetical protein